MPALSWARPVKSSWKPTVNSRPPLPSHSYFNVGDIAAVKVSGLGERYIDKVNNAEEGVLSNGVQTFPDRTDRVYLNADSCSVIHDDALNRTIDVVHHHQHNVVALEPGPGAVRQHGRYAGRWLQNLRLRRNLLRNPAAESQRRDALSPGANHQREKR